ncbi:MAG: SDR family NAD(P)-dependent oxidoreductase [Firmicutes bacterium]|nr:SDR family NAD(P)-dependent oxidoreductase [Bacillota bacterium]
MEIAIIGTSVLYPGSTDDRGFWRDIVNGRDLIEEVPADRWLIRDYYDPDPAAEDMTYVKRGAFLSPILFDPMTFGMPPANLSATDTSQLLALVAAKRLLDALAKTAGDLDRDRISVILGVASTTELVLELNARLQHPKWRRVLEASGVAPDVAEAISARLRGLSVPWQEASFPGLLGNVVAGRIANRFDLGGTNAVVDAACASSLAAVEMAVLELEAHRADLVLTGGVDTLNDIFMYMCFSKTRALSPTGDCRPFSDQADGTILGEGIGLFALKRLRDAERDGDAVLAVIRGLGSSSDGSGTAIYAPKSSGQAKALARAYRDAGVSPRTVELVEAHGTGTAAGDVAEFEALSAIYGADGDRDGGPWCALGSVKSQIGHTKAAAGAAGLFKAVMALHHRILPPTIKVESPNPRLHVGTTPFYLNTEARPWVHHPVEPRRAAVSAFGFGGSNFHLVLEEYRSAGGKRPPKLRTVSSEWIPWAAVSRKELRDALHHILATRSAESLSTLAYDCQRQFDGTQPVRLGVVCQSREELDELLKLAVANLDHIDAGQSVHWPAGVYFGEGPRRGPLALLFPGQGSQYLAMGRDVALTYDAVRAVLDELADQAWDGLTLSQVLYPHSLWTEEDRATARQRLTDTRWAQPAIGAVSAGYLALLQQIGVAADAAAGHSFGELTALYAAGAIDLTALVQLARRRGQLMAEAAEGRFGAMTAVLTDRDRLRAELDPLGIAVSIAGDNAPDQVVMAGDVTDIERAEAHLANVRIAYRRLDVSAAFHTPHVAPAVDPFRQALDAVEWAPLTMPVYSNVSGGRHDLEDTLIKDRLAAQIAEPLQFRTMLEAMYRDGIRLFVEVGPGSALTALVKRTLGDRVAAVALDRPGQDGVTSLCHALAQLASWGVPFDPLALWQEYAVVEDTKEHASPAAVMISGSNYGKPYPAVVETLTTLPELATPRAPLSTPRDESFPLPPAVEPTLPPWEPLPDQEWLDAMEDAVAKAHITFQEALSQGHQAFLKMAEETVRGLTSGAGPLKMTKDAPTVDPWPQAHQAARDLRENTASFPREKAPPLDQRREPQPPSRVASPSRVEEGDRRAPVMDAWTLVRAVVAEKTGYPGEMLRMEQTLEQDLGIDSIKRVEILSTLAERAGGTRTVDPEALGRLRTLGDVVKEIESLGGNAARAGDLGDSRVSGEDAWALVRAVVAEKTGYPAEMLRREQTLEQDLGIDSIKRVEILSTLAERAGGARTVDPEALGRLRTLGDVVKEVEGLPAKERDAVGPQMETPNTRPSLKTWTMSLQPDPLRGLSLYHPKRHGPLYLVGSSQNVAPAISDELKGLPVVLVDSALDVPDDARAILYLEAADLLTHREDAVRVNAAAFRCARRLASEGRDASGLFVTVQRTGGDFGRSAAEPSAWSAGLSGLVKTLGQELPGIAVKTIDIGSNISSKEAAHLIAQELLQGGPDIEVGYQDDGTRVVPVLAESRWDGDPMPLEAQSVLLVSGGARGVTAAIVKALASQAPLKIGILGRTALLDLSLPRFRDQAEARAWAFKEAQAGRGADTPVAIAQRAAELLQAQEVAATLAELEALGSEVLYVPCDIRDSEAVGSAIQIIRHRYGPITAVLHGAGVIRDRRLQEKSDDDFHAVFDTKVRGLMALLDHTRRDPVTHLAMVSSVTGRFGNPGQSDYAMANAVLNAVATSEQRRRGENAAVVAWTCGPWDGGMVDGALRHHFLEQGVHLIPLAEGATSCATSWQLRLPAAEWVICASSASPEPTPGVRREHVSYWPLSVTNVGYLAGHTIHGTVVVPMAVAMDRMGRAAQACMPELQPVEMRDVRVLRGIRLTHFFDGRDTVEVLTSHATRFFGDLGSPGLAVDVKLQDLDGTALYQGQVILARSSSLNAREEALRVAPGPWPCTRDEIYTVKLFHEGAFAVIEEVEHFSEEGATAYLRVPQNMDLHEAAALAWDGGLQILGVWGLTYIERRTLPTSIDQLILGRPLLAGERVHCTVRVKEADAHRLVADIGAVGANGEPVFRLLGVKMHAIGEKTQSWRQTRAVAP